LAYDTIELVLVGLARVLADGDRQRPGRAPAHRSTGPCRIACVQMLGFWLDLEVDTPDRTLNSDVKPPRTARGVHANVTGRDRSARARTYVHLRTRAAPPLKQRSARLRSRIPARRRRQAVSVGEPARWC
jgi:hypothetical protein